MRQKLVASPVARGAATARHSTVNSSIARRRGVSLYLFVLAFPMMIGLLGIVIDLGNLYTKRAQAQRAADAAAIAGAMEGATGDIDGKAQTYATLNGYQDGINGARVKVISTVSDNSTEVQVTVSRNEAVYFAPILEGFLQATGQSQTAAQFSRDVSAQGTARIKTSLPLGLGGIYGIADPARSPVNNSIVGPYARYDFGDPFATKYLQDGVTANPRYTQTDGVQEYTLHITTDYLNKHSDVALQIFDPDCYGGASQYDEIWTPSADIPNPPPGPNETTTVYEIVRPDGQTIASATYGADPATEGQWVTPNGFSFTPTVAGDYKLRVRTSAGSSENGFQLRAGPSAGANLSDDEWNQTYGDKNGTDQSNVALGIDAGKHLQLNFTQSGTVKFRLGYVPAQDAGNKISVSKFDVDVGSQSIVYTCDTLPGQTFPGVIPNPSNGTWSTDDISIPPGYEGGNWYAEYVAEKYDTSSWMLSGQSGTDREVRLIK